MALRESPGTMDLETLMSWSVVHRKEKKLQVLLVGFEHGRCELESFFGAGVLQPLGPVD